MNEEYLRRGLKLKLLEISLEIISNSMNRRIEAKRAEKEAAADLRLRTMARVKEKQKQFREEHSGESSTQSE